MLELLKVLCVVGGRIIFGGLADKLWLGEHSFVGGKREGLSIESAKVRDYVSIFLAEDHSQFGL